MSPVLGSNLSGALHMLWIHFNAASLLQSHIFSVITIYVIYTFLVYSMSYSFLGRLEGRTVLVRYTVLLIITRNHGLHLKGNVIMPHKLLLRIKLSCTYYIFSHPLCVYREVVTCPQQPHQLSAIFKQAA